LGTVARGRPTSQSFGDYTLPDFFAKPTIHTGSNIKQLRLGSRSNLGVTDGGDCFLYEIDERRRIVLSCISILNSTCESSVNEVRLWLERDCVQFGEPVGGGWCCQTGLATGR